MRSRDMSAAVPALPQPRGPLVPALVRTLMTLWSREPVATAVGATGVIAGAGLAIMAAVRGNAVPPEGNLLETATFDGAVGMLVLTMAVLAPLAAFTRRGHGAWVGSVLVFVLSAYALETVQAIRGLDPRFTEFGGPADQALGGVFFLVAQGVMVTFLVVAAKYFRPSTSHLPDALRLAVRYGAAAALIAFGIGDAMSFIGGRHVGTAGNLLPLHAAGFHGMQALPLVALLLAWSQASEQEAKMVTHVAGIAWLGACCAIAVQSFSGNALMAPGIWLALAIIALAAWTSCALIAVRVALRKLRPVS